MDTFLFCCQQARVIVRDKNDFFTRRLIVDNMLYASISGKRRGYTLGKLEAIEVMKP